MTKQLCIVLLVLKSMKQLKLLLIFSAIIGLIIVLFWASISDSLPKNQKPFSLNLREIWPLQVTNSNYTKHSKFHTRNVFEERIEKLRNVCSEESSSIPAPSKINKLIWSMEEENKLLMCRTAKHGSTTWSSIFVQIYTKG